MDVNDKVRSGKPKEFENDELQELLDKDLSSIIGRACRVKLGINASSVSRAEKIVRMEETGNPILFALQRRQDSHGRLIRSRFLAFRKLAQRRGISEMTASRGELRRIER
uniref:Uncharacterized protein n=1 Tax=Vespula pensylvanica TaxID=30213 RepID=A0A834NWC6_VESPE|nr:hypothetical protein H0235_010060 [Vespula pensylvanica]